MKLTARFYRHHRHFTRLLAAASLALAFLLVSQAVIWAAPLMRVQKTVSLVQDGNGNGRANPGDRLEYSVVIENIGDETATGLSFSDTLDENTTLVAGSLRTTPLAIPDSYSAYGNIQISIAAPGVLTNDFGLPAPSVTAHSPTSANGGNVTVQSDGSFTYNPPPGFKGTDSFSYTISNGSETDTATVSISVSNMVWFVKADAASGGDGRLTTPFNCLGGTGCLRDSLTSNEDIIYFYAGSYPVQGTAVGLILKDGQKVYGQTVDLAGLLPNPPTGSLPYPSTDSQPTLSHSSNDLIQLASNNTLQGLRLEISANQKAALKATGNMGTSTITDVQVAPSGNNYGVQLVNLSGTFNFNQGSINAASSGPAVNIHGNGNGTIRFDTQINNTGGRPVSVQNRTGGEVTFVRTVQSNGQGVYLNSNSGSTQINFQGPVSSTTGGSEIGVQLLNNNGTTVIFSGGLTVYSEAGSALRATGGGTLTVSGDSNTLQAGNGSGLYLSGVNIGAGGLTFRSISSSGGSEPGIYLDNTGTNAGLTVTGTGTTSGSGGTITGKTGGDPAPGSVPSTGAGIVLKDTLNPSLTNMNLSTFHNFAIFGLNVTGLTVSRTNITGINGNNSSYPEGSIYIRNLLGSASISNSLINGGYSNNIYVANSSGTLNRLTISSSTIGVTDNTNGNDGLYFETSGTADGRLTVTSSAFFGARGDMFQANALDNSNLDVNLSGNSLTNTHSNIVSGGGGVTVSGGSASAGPTVTYRIENNTIRGASGHALLVHKGQGSGSFAGIVQGNTIGQSGVANSGSIEASGIAIASNGGGSHSTQISNNQVYGTNETGILVTSGDGSSSMSAIIQSNTVSQPGPLTFAGIYVEAGALAGDSGSLCLQMTGNSITGSSSGAGTDYYVSQVGLTTINLSGYSGAANNLAAITTYLSGLNSGAPGLTDLDLGTIQGGPACSVPQLTSGSSGMEVISHSNQPSQQPAIDPPLTANASARSAWERVSDKASTAWETLTGRIGGLAKLLPAWGQRPLAAGETIEVEGFNLPAGKTITIRFQAEINDPFPASMSSICNRGWLSGSNIPTIPSYNPTPEGPVGLTCINVYLIADLEIEKTAGASTAVPGESIIYTISASNNGPHDSEGARIVDTFAASLGGVTWTCAATSGAACTASGSGNIDETISLPAGASAVFTVSGTIDPAATGTITNTASIVLPGNNEDPDSSNNSAQVETTLTPQADLVITKSDGEAQAVPGEAIGYTIGVRNDGPSDAPGSSIQDNFPANISNGSWTCSAAGGAICPAASGSGNLDVTANLPAGGSLVFTTDGLVDPGASGQLTNTATVSPAATVTDLNLDNNQASDQNTLTPIADLAVTKTNGVDSLVPGESVTYTLSAANLGPSNASGVVFSDTFPAAISGVTWTCSASGGAVCPAGSGTGNIHHTLNLPAGGSLAYSASGTVSPDAFETVSNSATITAPAGVSDPEPGNNSASDTDLVTPLADLQILKTSPSTFVQNGQAANFQIIITNPDGPSNISGVTVSDTLPAGLLDATWTCSASGEATCGAASGSGSILEVVNLPANSSVTYDLQATVATDASGPITNSATITAPSGVSDPDMTNNIAEATVQVDAPPQINSLSVDRSEINENESVSLTVRFSDPDLPEAHQVVIDWGDDSQTSTNLAAGVLETTSQHTYLDDVPSGAGTADYTIQVIVSEADGGTDSATTSVTVLNVAPQMISLGAAAIMEGETAILNGSFSDPGSLDSFSIGIDWGDGSPVEMLDYPAGSTGFSATHTYNNNPPGEPEGQYTIQVTVEDDDTGSDSGSTAVQVSNQAPQVNAGPDTSSGLLLQRSGSFSDPGDDSWTATVDYGDGSGTQALALDGKTFELEHSYTSSGLYTVTVTVTDSDGAAGSDSFNADVIINADLTLIKIGDQDTPLAGARLAYTLIAANLGPGPASQVTIVDPLPPGTTFNSASAGCAHDSGVVTCTLDTLADQASASFEITVTIDAQYRGTLTNQASIMADEPDPNLDNNIATATVTVQATLPIYESDFGSGDLEGWLLKVVSTTPSGRVFLGEFGTLPQVLTLTNLPQHCQVNLDFTLFIIRSWDGNLIHYTAELARVFGVSPSTVVGPDIWELSADGTPLLTTTFANWPAFPQAYPGGYPGGEYPGRTGASEGGSLGYDFYQASGMDSVYKLRFNFPHQADSLALTFAARGLQGINDESWGLEDVKVELSCGADTMPHKLFLPVIGR